MSYQKDKLELLAGGGASTRIWAYSYDTDDMSAISTAGYFPKESSLRVNDLLYINASDDNVFMRVKTIANGVITLDTKLSITTSS